MNIDLRNISPEFEKQVNEVKKQYGFSTNTKAVEYCVLHLLSSQEVIKSLKSKLLETGTELKEINNNVNSFFLAFENLKK